MANEPNSATSADAALQPFPTGEITRLVSGSLQVDIAADAGGRIARISHEGNDWLIGYDSAHAAMIAWGCYPMLPWAGRIRHGRFVFEGKRYQLPINLEENAIHGVAFGLPWQIVDCRADRIALSLELPRDQRWPFGGVATQWIALTDRSLHCRLSVQGVEQAMPRPVLGWHPWFIKPDRLEFQPEAFYPRDAEGIAHKPVAPPPPGPWDDCFVNRAPVTLHRNGKQLRLESDCDHWVVYDLPAHATCVEPQTGPPDAFNLEPATLLPGAVVEARLSMVWK